MWIWVSYEVLHCLGLFPTYRKPNLGNVEADCLYTAYHSHHMLPLAPMYIDSLIKAGICFQESPVGSGCEMFSSVTQNKLQPAQCHIGYWGQNMVSTVRFTAAITEAFNSHDLDVLVEVGPHPALKGPAMDTLSSLGKSDVKYFGSCFRNTPDLEAMLDTVGVMIGSGLPVLSANINGLESIQGLRVSYEFGNVLTNLPSYQWDHSMSHWAESRVSQNQRFREFPRHQLLGARKSDDNPLCMSWRNIISLKEVQWLEKIMVCDGSHVRVYNSSTDNSNSWRMK